jgi:hypothetical protein
VASSGCVTVIAADSFKDISGGGEKGGGGITTDRGGGRGDDAIDWSLVCDANAPSSLGTTGAAKAADVDTDARRAEDASDGELATPAAADENVSIKPLKPCLTACFCGCCDGRGFVGGGECVTIVFVVRAAPVGSSRGSFGGASSEMTS